MTILWESGEWIEISEGEPYDWLFETFHEPYEGGFWEKIPSPIVDGLNALHLWTPEGNGRAIVNPSYCSLGRPFTAYNARAYYWFNTLTQTIFIHQSLGRLGVTPVYVVILSVSSNRIELGYYTGDGVGGAGERKSVVVPYDFELGKPYCIEHHYEYGSDATLWVEINGERIINVEHVDNTLNAKPWSLKAMVLKGSGAGQDIYLHAYSISDGSYIGMIPQPPPPNGFIQARAYYDSDEVDASVEIMGVGTFTTPFSTGLPPGPYTLNATYQEQIQTQPANVLSGQTTTVQFNFTAPPTPPPPPPPPETEPVQPLFPALREKIYPIAPNAFDRFDEWRTSKNLRVLAKNKVRRG